jgi:hypothetical protein
MMVPKIKKAYPIVVVTVVDTEEHTTEIAPAVTAVSLLLNERFICPSTRKR